MSVNPPQKDKVCYGINLADYDTNNTRTSGRLNFKLADRTV